VIYGAIVPDWLVPFIQKLFNIFDGTTLLVQNFIVLFMVLPTIIGVTSTSLNAASPIWESIACNLGADPPYLFCGLWFQHVPNYDSRSPVLDELHRYNGNTLPAGNGRAGIAKLLKPARIS